MNVVDRMQEAWVTPSDHGHMLGESQSRMRVTKVVVLEHKFLTLLPDWMTGTGP